MLLRSPFVIDCVSSRIPKKEVEKKQNSDNVDEDTYLLADGGHVQKQLVLFCLRVLCVCASIWTAFSDYSPNETKVN